MSQPSNSYFLTLDNFSPSPGKLDSTSGGYYVFIDGQPLIKANYELASLTVNGKGLLDPQIDPSNPALVAYPNLGTYFYANSSVSKALSANSGDYLAVLVLNGHDAKASYTYKIVDGLFYYTGITGAAVSVKGVGADLSLTDSVTGAITVDGGVGDYAFASIYGGDVASTLKFDGVSSSDMYYELSPITTFNGAAINVKTSGDTGGDVYFELDDTQAGAITVATGKAGGAYGTLFESSALSSLVFKQVLDYTWVDEEGNKQSVYSDTFTVKGAGITVTSEVSNITSDVYPGNSYIEFLNQIYSSVADIIGWSGLSDRQKADTFISDLFFSGETKGDLGSYYNFTLGEAPYSSEIANSQLGAFLLLADADSGAITSTAKQGSNVVVMYNTKAMSSADGDIWQTPIYDNDSNVIGTDTTFAFDNISGSAIKVTGDSAFFSATEASLLGALTADAKAGDVVINILDSDVVTNVGEGSYGYLGESLGFADWEDYSPLFTNITGASVKATATNDVTFSLDYGSSGAVDLKGNTAYANFYDALVVSSIKYTESGMGKLTGDTGTISGAATKLTSNTGAYLESDYSDHGAITVTATNGGAGAYLSEAMVVTKAEYDFKWYNSSDGTLIDEIPVDGNEPIPWWKYPGVDYYSQEQLKTLTGAAVSIKGIGADLNIQNSVTGAITVDGGVGEALINISNSLIVNKIETNNDITGSSLKVSGQSALISLENVYLSKLDFTNIKTNVALDLNYNSMEIKNFENTLSFEINLKAANQFQDSIILNEEASNLNEITITGFEFDKDLINDQSYLNFFSLETDLEANFDVQVRGVASKFVIDWDWS